MEGGLFWRDTSVDVIMFGALTFGGGRKGRRRGRRGPAKTTQEKQEDVGDKHYEGVEEERQKEVDKRRTTGAKGRGNRATTTSWSADDGRRRAATS